MIYLTGWPSSRPVARRSLSLVGIFFAVLRLVLLLRLVRLTLVVVAALGDGEEEALLAVVVPERSSSLVSLSLCRSDLVKRLPGLVSSSSSGGSGLALGGVAL